MARTYHLLFPLFSIFLVRVDLTDLKPIEMTIKDVQVIDGDTIKFSWGGKLQSVRLLYIDAPELGQRDGQYDLGLYSSKCLKKLIATPLKLYLYGFDQYGRMLGEIPGINLSMIERGCAYIYEYSHFPSRRLRTRYMLAQNKSQELRRGLWNFKVLNPRLHRRKHFGPQ